MFKKEGLVKSCECVGVCVCVRLFSPTIVDFESMPVGSKKTDTANGGRPQL